MLNNTVGIVPAKLPSPSPLSTHLKMTMGRKKEKAATPKQAQVGLISLQVRSLANHPTSKLQSCVEFPSPLDAIIDTWACCQQI